MPGSAAANELAPDLMREIAAEHSALCRSAKAALEALKPSLADLRESRRLPGEVFAFSLFERDFDSNDEPVFRAIEVLPFPDRASCENAEVAARQSGLPTRACAEWKPLTVESFYALVELELLDLRYLFAPPTGKPSPQLNAAIKAFQRDLGHEETGSLLFGEWEELSRRHRRIEPIPIYVGFASVIAVGDLARAKGTWVFDSDKPEYVQANPIQTTVIECNRRSGTCVDATADIWYREDAGTLSVLLQTWHITKWSDSEIVAENDQAQCVSYTLSINLRAKEASAFRRGKGTPGCEAFSTSPQILDLARGG